MIRNYFLIALRGLFPNGVSASLCALPWLVTSIVNQASACIVPNQTSLLLTRNCPQRALQLVRLTFEGFGISCLFPPPSLIGSCPHGARWHPHQRKCVTKGKHNENTRSTPGNTSTNTLLNKSRLLNSIRDHTS